MPHRLRRDEIGIFRKAIAEKATPEELSRESRDLQDEIYDRRCRGPLIFNWIYNCLKKGHEEQVNKGAEALVEEALKRVKSVPSTAVELS